MKVCLCIEMQRCKQGGETHETSVWDLMIENTASKFKGLNLLNLRNWHIFDWRHTFLEQLEFFSQTVKVVHKSSGFICR